MASSEETVNVVRVGDIVDFEYYGETRRGKVLRKKGSMLRVEYEPSPGTLRSKIGVKSSTWTYKWKPVPQATEGGTEEKWPTDREVAECAEARAEIELSKAPYMTQALSVVVVGASGDLAKKKTYPALLDLFAHGHLPEPVTIVGVARTPMTDFALRVKLQPFLEKTDTDPELVQRFLQMCSYRAMKSYADEEAMTALNAELSSLEAAHPSGVANRLFYFAIPPNVFLDTAATIKKCAVPAQPSGTAEGPQGGFTRLIVEKPFGRDFDSASQLSDALVAIFPEESIYRIDHYLGKEMVQNILTMRFGNLLFRSIWSCESIASVQITFKEDFGTQGRGGYFDNYGIIRDILQNHLMQVLALVAMEEPLDILGANAGDAIRDAKVAVLRQVRPIDLTEVVLGQYAGLPGGEAAYLEDPTVPEGSTTPTFATVVLYVDNPRWLGVPFIMRAGKALDERKAEVRFQLRDPPAVRAGALDGQPCPKNELVFRLQPNEAVYFKSNIKAPGLSSELQQVELDLDYKTRFFSGPGPRVYAPDAYTRLLLDALVGRQANFVRSDELLEAWKIWDPLLKQVDQGDHPQLPVRTYPFGGRGPPESDALIQRLGYERNKDYAWRPAHL